MAASTVLDAIELFNAIGQHYAHPRLDPAAPPLALAGAMQQLFALVETAFHDAVRALDVDLALDHLQNPSHCAPARLRFSLSPEPEDKRVFVQREDGSACGSSPLSSPAPATPSDVRAPAWSAKGKGKEVMHYPPAPVSSFGFSSVDWNFKGPEDDDSDDDDDDDDDDDAMDEIPLPPVPPAPRIVPNAALSVLHAPHMIPQPRGTSSRPPPRVPRRRPPPSAASASSSSSAALPPKKELTVRRKSTTPAPAKKLARPLAKRHSAPDIMHRRATRTAKANAHLSWSCLVSKRRKSGSAVAEEDEEEEV